MEVHASRSIIASLRHACPGWRCRPLYSRAFTERTRKPASMSVTYTGPYKKGDIKKVVLAYSGGLDTSVILKWLQTTYGCEVVTFTADLGQGEELGPARKKAEMLGIKPENIFIDDVREEFVKDFVFPMFRANALYEGQYLLGTSIARPLIAKRQIEIAREVGADAVCHGATGKGNDQVPLRAQLLCAEARHQGDRAVARMGAHLAHQAARVRRDSIRSRSPRTSAARRRSRSTPTSCTPPARARSWRIPGKRPTRCVYQRTISPEAAPDKATYITVDFEKGDAVAIDGVKMSPATLLTKLNELGKANGIGRLDLVENRFVGMKSRGIYETPGGTILYAAHRGIESITLDRGAGHLKDELMPKYAELIYYGFWYSPEREMLQALIDKSQENVTGTVRLKLYKGNTTVVGRKSPKSLYSMKHVTFEDDAGAYDQRDAEGFIKLNALRLRLRATGQGGPKK